MKQFRLCRYVTFRKRKDSNIIRVIGYVGDMFYITKKDILQLIEWLQQAQKEGGKL